MRAKISGHVNLRINAVGALIVGVLLAACQSSAPQKAPLNVPQTKTAAPSIVAAERVLTAPKIQPAVRLASKQREPARVYSDPKILMGRGAANLIDVIGAPEFIRKDHPAEIWQYRGSKCTLDIFLYQVTVGVPHKVDYIETRANNDGPSSNKECLISILKERDTAPVSQPNS